MFKTMIITAAIGAAAAGGWWYGQSSVPTADATPQPAAVTASQAPLTAPLPLVQPATVLTCSAAPQAAQTAPQAVAQAPQATGTAGLVNVNTATQAELEALPGIGAKTAQRIMAARPIAAVADIGKLPGITPARFAEFQSKITV